jgi:hypothetical protein
MAFRLRDIFFLAITDTIFEAAVIFPLAENQLKAEFCICEKILCHGCSLNRDVLAHFWHYFFPFCQGMKKG